MWENKKFHKFRSKGVNPFLEVKWDLLFRDSYATGKFFYTPSMGPSQPIIIKNDGGDESNENNSNEDNTGLDNFQSNPCIQSALMNEETFMAQFIEDISTPAKDTST